MYMDFATFSQAWKRETFLAAAFNDERDFDEFLDDPECGVGNKAFDEFADEIDFLVAQHPFILYNPRKPIGVCKFCGSPLYPSKVYGYKYECLECDEDFYAFEQE